MILEAEDLDEFEILDYFEDDYKEYWREQMLRTDWEGAGELVKLLEDEKFFEELGEGARLLMLTDGESLISYAAWDGKGDVKYLHTTASYRGNGCAGKLLAALKD